MPTNRIRITKRCNNCGVLLEFPKSMKTGYCRTCRTGYNHIAKYTKFMYKKGWLIEK